MNFLFENSCSDISDEGLNYLSESLKTLTSLESICLDFYR